MEKLEFLAKLRALYRLMNTADSECPAEPWMRPAMAGSAGCAQLDEMLRNMLDCGALTPDEHQAFYDML